MYKSINTFANLPKIFLPNFRFKHWTVTVQKLGHHSEFMILANNSVHVNVITSLRNCSKQRNKCNVRPITIITHWMNVLNINIWYEHSLIKISLWYFCSEWKMSIKYVVSILKDEMFMMWTMLYLQLHWCTLSAQPFSKNYHSVWTLHRKPYVWLSWRIIQAIKENLRHTRFNWIHVVSEDRFCLWLFLEKELDVQCANTHAHYSNLVKLAIYKHWYCRLF